MSKVDDFKCSECGSLIRRWCSLDYPQEVATSCKNPSCSVYGRLGCRGVVMAPDLAPEPSHFEMAGPETTICAGCNDPLKAHRRDCPVEQSGRMCAEAIDDLDTSNDVDPLAHRSAGMRCGTCMWFVEKTVPSGGNPSRVMGRCRRHSPTVNGYPVVFPDDWCGDHKLDEGKS